MNNITKCIFSLSLLLASSVTPAAELQFDLYASGGIAPSPPTHWVRGKHVPSTLHVSFILDTLSASTATYTPYTDPNNPSQPCLGHFAFTGLAVSNLSIQTDHGSLWKSKNLKSELYGDNASKGCPGGFFAGLEFNKGGRSFGWSFDPSPGISLADLASSTDPLATLLLGFQKLPPGNLALTGAWGTLYASPTATITVLSPPNTIAFSVTAVPLPNTIVLFASGFFGLAWKACRREVTRVAT